MLGRAVGLVTRLGVSSTKRYHSRNSMSTVVFIKLAKSKLKDRNHIRSIIRSSLCAYVN